MSKIGLLNINKPTGWTSRDVVNKVQKITGIRRCGHAGTLDPLATGVLVVCIGPATRLVPYLQQSRKIYRAQFRFGCRSDTDDIEGNIQQVDQPIYPEEGRLRELLKVMHGQIQQVPPKYSAVMVEGKRAYDLARQGEDFQLQAREVRIDRFELLKYDAPEWNVLIECGSGTYVRALGRDVGEYFQCGAIMASLERTAVGDLTVEEAVNLDELSRENYMEHLHPPRQAVTHLRSYECSETEAKSVRNGQRISVESLPGDEIQEIALFAPDQQLLGIAEWQPAKRRLQPRVIFQA